VGNQSFITLTLKDTMITAETTSLQIYLDRNLGEAESVHLAAGRALLFTAPCPDKEGPNEDAAAAIGLGEGTGILAVADGFGGHQGGAEAAAIAVRAIAESVRDMNSSVDDLRALIMDGFDRANGAVLALGIGAATTLAVLEISGRRVRPYHVGDSEILVVGQRGRLKWRTVSHSPIGYAMQAGLVDEVEAMNHAERHLVSNMVGSADMRIEVGPLLKLAPRDTVLIASDGLFDNLVIDDIVEAIRKGPLERAIAQLALATQMTMSAPGDEEPSKPDDLTIVGYRLDP
jgi:serine/threonine protein phosphatase PrpC